MPLQRPKPVVLRREWEWVKSGEHSRMRRTEAVGYYIDFLEVLEVI